MLIRLRYYTENNTTWFILTLQEFGLIHFRVSRDAETGRKHGVMLRARNKFDDANNNFYSKHFGEGKTAFFGMNVVTSSISLSKHGFQYIILNEMSS